MKILHIIDSEGLYGAEVMLINLAEEQIRLGHNPIIASIREKHEDTLDLEDEAKRRGLETITFRMVDGPNIYGAWRILNHAWNNNFDILHTHGYKGDILLGFIPRTLRRLPLVSTLHGWTSAGHLSKRLIYEYIDSLALKYVDAICMVNKSMLSHKWLRSLKTRIHIIPNGISPLLSDKIDEVEDDITKFCNKGFTVVSIGRLSKEKGYHNLIEAFGLFLNDVKDARLLIIGEGAERRHLEYKINKMGIGDKVLLPGYRNQAWRYLTHCKVFVLSSLTEGLPMTLLEAMQVGIPVIATTVGGIPNVIIHEETGFLVPADNIYGIYTFLNKIYNNHKHSADIAHRAKKHIMSEFTSSKVAEKYIEVYKMLDNRN